MKTLAVIFDKDGVLTNSEMQKAKAWNIALAIQMRINKATYKSRNLHGTKTFFTGIAFVLGSKVALFDVSPLFSYFLLP